MKKDKKLLKNQIRNKILIFHLLVFFIIILCTCIAAGIIGFFDYSSDTIQKFRTFCLIFSGIMINLTLYFALLNSLKTAKITEKVMRKHKNDLQLILDTIPAMIWYKDAHNNYIRVNMEAAALLGLQPENIVGKSAHEIYPEDADTFYKEDLEVINNNTPMRNILRKLTMPNGQLKWINIDKIPYYDDEGNITGIIVFGFDITEKIEKQDELSRQNAMLEALVDTIPALIFMKDKDLKYQKINNQCNNFYGLNPEDVLGKTVFDIFSADQAEIYHNNDVSVLQSGKPVLNDIQRIQTSSGKVNWTSCYKAPFRNPNGEIIGLVGILYDVNEQMMLEEELIQKIIEQEVLLNTIPAFISYKDTNLKYIAVNKALKELYGKNESDIIGKDDFDFISKADAEAQREIGEEVIRTGKPKTNMISNIISNNKECWISTSMYPYQDRKGNINGIVTITTDITEQKRIECELKQIISENKKLLDELVEADKIKTAFIANISHEFRTPLNVILSTLQLISTYQRQPDVNPKYAVKFERYTDIMKSNCFRLLRLINNLIDITRIESGFITMNIHNYDIVQILEEITMSVSEYVEKHGLTLEFNTNIEEKIIACDADKIERVLLNLLSNAVKFTKPGGKIAANLIDCNDVVKISIRDTGIGIPEDKLDLIFDRFTQLNQTLTRDHEGSGIGLYLVKSLVEMHNGKVYVKSELGKGTEFILEFPNTALAEDKFEQRDISFNEIASTAGIEFSDIY